MDKIKKFGRWAFFTIFELMLGSGVVKELFKPNPDWLGIVIILGLMYIVWQNKPKD